MNADMTAETEVRCTDSTTVSTDRSSHTSSVLRNTEHYIMTLTF